MRSTGFNSISLIATILFVFGEIALLYLTPRNETTQLLTVYFAVFAAYIILYHEVRNIRTAAFLGVFLRCIAWLAFPQLSDDIYRFIWDGSIILEGVNPFLQTPTSFFSENVRPPFEQIYPKLNSSGYYSVYPLIMQVVSAFGALANNDFYLSALIIKLPILIAEIGTIWILPKLLLDLNISPKYSVLYMLNPLLIIDVLGNAHFEAVVIFFVLLSIKYIKSGNHGQAGLALALAVATKLTPLILFPFIIKGITPERRMRFAAIFVIATLILFTPILNVTFFKHFSESLLLYFKSFEFNASIYYVVRWIGEQVVGYNPISVIGPALSLVTFAICGVIWWRQEPKSIHAALLSMLWAYTVFLLLSTTVHPWYVAPLLILGILSRKQFPIVWTAFIFLSYSVYQTESNNEQIVFVIIEYTALGLAILFPKRIRKFLVTTLEEI